MVRLLIVDDDPSIVEMYRVYLELLGHEVATAGDGFAALEVVDQIRPDLIILDLRLPRLDGLGVLARLSAFDYWPAIPVLMFSNNNDPEEMAKARRLGCVEYLLKSQTSPAALAGRVAHWAGLASKVNKALRDQYA